MPRCPKPELDSSKHGAYWARVVIGKAWGYSAPYGCGGSRQPPHFNKGEVVMVVAVEDVGNYVSALTAAGNWINLWTLHNKKCQPVGVHFCEVTPADEGPASGELETTATATA